MTTKKHTTICIPNTALTSSNLEESMVFFSPNQGFSHHASIATSNLQKFANMVPSTVTFGSVNYY